MQEGEKKMKEGQDEEERKKREAEAKEAADKAEDEDDDEDEDDNEAVEGDAPETGEEVSCFYSIIIVFILRNK
jgi:calreticulin